MAMATMQSPRSSDFVYVTVEAGWVESSLNTSGLKPTIANLEYSLDLVKRYVYFSKSDDLKAVGPRNKVSSWKVQFHFSLKLNYRLLDQVNIVPAGRQPLGTSSLDLQNPFIGPTEPNLVLFSSQPTMNIMFTTCLLY